MLISCTIDNQPLRAFKHRSDNISFMLEISSLSKKVIKIIFLKLEFHIIMLIINDFPNSYCNQLILLLFLDVSIRYTGLLDQKMLDKLSYLILS